MDIKEIEDWAKPVVDSEIDSEMYSRLEEKCRSGLSFQDLEGELGDFHYFLDSVYVESLMAAVYFFWRHEYHTHSIFYSCKRMIESGMPLGAMLELTGSKGYLKNYASNIRLFYDKILSESFGPFREDSAFAILEKSFCE